MRESRDPFVQKILWIIDFTMDLKIQRNLNSLSFLYLASKVKMMDVETPSLEFKNPKPSP